MPEIKYLGTLHIMKKIQVGIYCQSGFQSGLETAPLAAVSAGYCHFLGQFQAKSRT